jgi:hypothetical protein
LIGMLVVDPLTGAMYRLPESASGNMTASPAAVAVAADISPAQ